MSSHSFDEGTVVKDIIYGAVHDLSLMVDSEVHKSRIHQKVKSVVQSARIEGVYTTSETISMVMQRLAGGTFAHALNVLALLPEFQWLSEERIETKLVVSEDEIPNEVSTSGISDVLEKLNPDDPMPMSLNVAWSARITSSGKPKAFVSLGALLVQLFRLRYGISKVDCNNGINVAVEKVALMANPMRMDQVFKMLRDKG